MTEAQVDIVQLVINSLKRALEMDDHGYVIEIAIDSLEILIRGEPSDVD